MAGLGALLLTACARPRVAHRGERSKAAVGAACPPTARPVRLRKMPQRGAAPKAPYGVIRRAQWGAEPLKDNHDPMERISRITLHHTATLPEMNARSDLDLVKGVQDFHRNTRGWADIGYHWLIGFDGNLYEGRALDVQGAHAGGGNNVENLGISVIGNFTTALPAPKQLRTVARFLEEQMEAYGVSSAELYGHRDFKATECPGGALYEWLQTFKRSMA